MPEMTEKTNLYTTGEIAKLCGVSVRTVQYYDTRNILIPSELSEGGRRLYSENELKRMKIICFLRDTGLSINNISDLLADNCSDEVISLLLDEHEGQLTRELSEIEEKLDRVRAMKRQLKNSDKFSLEAINDIAYMMENRKQLKKLRMVMLLSGIPVSLFEWCAIILWITLGIWWPFAAYTAIAIPYAIWISTYYFKRTAYICPQCHEIFKPKFREAMFANHTPTLRKLTCPHCKHKGFCVETYGKEVTNNKNNGKDTEL